MGNLLNREYLERFKDGLSEGEGGGVAEFASKQISVTSFVRTESHFLASTTKKLFVTESLPILTTARIVFVPELTRKVSTPLI